MRQIKFRAWNTREKHMIDWIVMRQTAFNRDMGRGYGLMYTIFTNQVQGSSASGFILMQYTELKDKNGNDIYEGDIIQVNGEKNMPVVYDGGCYRTPYNTSKYRLAGWANEAIEIIGNLYENPELQPTLQISK